MINKCFANQNIVLSTQTMISEMNDGGEIKICNADIRLSSLILLMTDTHAHVICWMFVHIGQK